MLQTVLIVDDEVNITQSFQRLFRKQPYRILIAHSGAEALDILERESVDVIVSDQRMPGMTGAELFSRVQHRYPNTVRLLLSGYTDFQALTYAINNGAISEFISKPWNRDELAQSLTKAFERSKELGYRSDYDKAFQNASQGMLLLDNDFNIVSVNQAQLDQTGHSEQDLVGQLLFEAMPELDQELVSRSIDADDQWQGELWLLRKDKSIGLFALNLQRNPDTQRSALSCSDITAIRRSELSSRHDLLTGLLNRQSFEKEVAQRLEQDGAGQVAVLSLDLVNFRQVNESYGHEVGDEVLCQVALSLRKLLSEQSDIRCIARVGGDEFCLLCRVTDKNSALALCETILDWFVEPIPVQQFELFMHFKMGIALTSESVALSAAELLKRSATAGARCDRTERYRLYSDTMLVDARERMDLHNDLHRVINNNELSLLYQPKIDVTNGRITSTEALVRWNHPSKGLIRPDQFVFLAEETGLILDIGDWCISEACRQLAQWQQRGLGEITIAVNLSPRQFADPALPHRLQALKQHHQFSAPARLELEVTESTLLDDSDRAIEMMEQIRALDIEFAMDDFGTGYASFDYLKRYPFSTLKIDRSFITHIGDSDKERSITESMISMGRQLGLKVVAEGVEEQHQADMVKTMGCDYIQGYLYSKPVDAQTFEQMLIAQPFTING